MKNGFLPVVARLLTVYTICKLTSAAGCCITLFSTADQTGYCSKPVSVTVSLQLHPVTAADTEAGPAATAKLLQHTKLSRCKNTDTLNIGPIQEQDKPQPALLLTPLLQFTVTHQL